MVSIGDRLHLRSMPGLWRVTQVGWETKEVTVTMVGESNGRPQTVPFRAIYEKVVKTPRGFAGSIRRYLPLQAES